MPIYVRAGSIIPYGADRLYTDNRIGPIVRLEVYAGADGRLDYDDGEVRFTATWQDSCIALDGLSAEVVIVSGL